MSEPIEHWSTLSLCRVCGDPVGTGEATCLHCGTPQELFSIQATHFYSQKLWRLAVGFFELLAKLFLIGVGLYICFTISPFLLFFPLFFVLSGDN